MQVCYVLHQAISSLSIWNSSFALVSNYVKLLAHKADYVTLPYIETCLVSAINSTVCISTHTIIVRWIKILAMLCINYIFYSLNSINFYSLIDLFLFLTTANLEKISLQLNFSVMLLQENSRDKRVKLVIIVFHFHTLHIILNDCYQELVGRF